MTDPLAPDHAVVVAVDADDPSALPPHLASRATRGGIPWGMLALESVFTVVAILTHAPWESAVAYLSDAVPMQAELSRSYEQTIARLRTEGTR